MEWIKDILTKHTKEDGTVDLDAANKEIDAEFPKNAVPKTDFNSKVEELKSANDTLESLKKDNKDVEALQIKITEHEATVEGLQKELADSRKQAAIDLALTKNKARNTKAVKALLDAKTLELTDEGVKGLDDQLKKVKEDNPFLFDEGEGTKGPTFSKNGNPNGTTKVTKEDFNKMGYSERLNLKQSDPGLFSELNQQ